MRNPLPAFMQRVTAVSVVTVLAGCGGGSGSSDTASEPAAALTVSAGENLDIDEGSTVELAGSIANTSGLVTVEWTQVSGPVVEFSTTDSLNTTISVPRLRDTAPAVLRLSVSDGTGEFSDDITVMVVNVSNGPDGPSPGRMPWLCR
ncbi:MAG: hypothetical protein AAFN78_16675 [Pseudomonadota bacterium]